MKCGLGTPNCAARTLTRRKGSACRPFAPFPPPTPEAGSHPPAEARGSFWAPSRGPSAGECVGGHPVPRGAEPALGRQAQRPRSGAPTCPPYCSPAPRRWTGRRSYPQHCWGLGAGVPNNHGDKTVVSLLVSGYLCFCLFSFSPSPRDMLIDFTGRGGGGREEKKH